MSPTAKPLNVVAEVCLVMAVGLHTLQLLSLGPWAFSWPRLTSWPTGFHLWLVESALIVTGIALFGVHHWRTRWETWIAGADAKHRALAIVALLVAAQIVLALGFWLTRDKGVDQLGGLRAVFWLGGEFRLPTIFAVLQAWLTGWLAWRCYCQEGAKVWMVTALLCFYIGADELLSIHEAVGVMIRHAGWFQIGDANTLQVWQGVRTYHWKLVFLPAAALVGIWLLRQFLHVLDRRSVALLVLAALMFVSGAVGFEIVQASGSSGAGWRTSTAGHLNLLIEETLETAGMTVAIYVFAQRMWSCPRATSSRSDAAPRAM